MLLSAQYKAQSRRISIFSTQMSGDWCFDEGDLKMTKWLERKRLISVTYHFLNAKSNVNRGYIWNFERNNGKYPKG